MLNSAVKAIKALCHYSKDLFPGNEMWSKSKKTLSDVDCSLYLWKIENVLFTFAIKASGFCFEQHFVLEWDIK